jgi:hypothetical protein
MNDDWKVGRPGYDPWVARADRNAEPNCKACGDTGLEDISTGGSYPVPCHCPAGVDLAAPELTREEQLT